MATSPSELRKEFARVADEQRYPNNHGSGYKTTGLCRLWQGIIRVLAPAVTTAVSLSHIARCIVVDEETGPLALQYRRCVVMSLSRGAGADAEFTWPTPAVRWIGTAYTLLDAGAADARGRRWTSSVARLSVSGEEYDAIPLGLCLNKLRRPGRDGQLGVFTIARRIGRSWAHTLLRSDAGDFDAHGRIILHQRAGGVNEVFAHQRGPQGMRSELVDSKVNDEAIVECLNR